MGFGATTQAWNVHTDFQLENHHIAGIFLGNDVAGLAGQAANIAVSLDLFEDDVLVTVRTYCGLNGTEYFAYWKHILEHPESETKPYNDAITYSTVFGRPTPIQARQIVPEEVQQPLQPKLVNGKRNKISGVDVWIWRINYGDGPPKIGGLKVYFENGDTYELGKWSAEKHYVEFKGAFCTRLSVWGNGALDYLEFALSDGRVVGYGTKNDARGVHTDFQLENHHIAGIYVGDDTAGLGGQAANISVSYQLTPKE
nr:uncharacterized protein LOC111517490 [Leptinotarsa decemlineata]